MILYFFPDHRVTDPAAFSAAGLGHALEPASRITPRRCPERGPSGGPGMVAVIDPAEDARIGFFADRQRWRQVPGSTAWVGVETDRPTLPDEVARRMQIGGHLIELADGRQWIVPIARAFIQEEGVPGYFCALPEQSRLDAEGRWQAGQVVERYRRLWQIAAEWDTALTDGREGETERGTSLATFEFGGLHERAVDVLAYNYRIGPAEADLLGLLSQQHCVQVLHAVVDMPARLAWAEKKTEEASAGGSS